MLFPVHIETTSEEKNSVTRVIRKIVGLDTAVDASTAPAKIMRGSPHYSPRSAAEREREIAYSTNG